LVVTETAVEMEVRHNGEIALQIDAVTFASATNSRLAGKPLLLEKIVAVLTAKGDDVTIPQAFV